MTRRLFALDHNFPQPVLAAMSDALPQVELVPVRDIDPGLTLVVAKGEGHNPVRAIGTLLCHLSHICHHTTRGTAQIWKLRVAQKNAEPARDYLETIAAKSRTTIQKLVTEHKLSASELRRG